MLSWVERFAQHHCRQWYVLAVCLVVLTVCLHWVAASSFVQSAAKPRSTCHSLRITRRNVFATGALRSQKSLVPCFRTILPHRARPHKHYASLPRKVWFRAELFSHLRSADNNLAKVVSLGGLDTLLHICQQSKNDDVLLEGSKALESLAHFGTYLCEGNKN